MLLEFPRKVQVNVKVQERIQLGLRWEGLALSFFLPTEQFYWRVWIYNLLLHINDKIGYVGGLLQVV